MKDQLQNAQQIQASYSAFAAILGDGFVVTWGGAGFGDDSSLLQDQLQNVQHIHGSKYALLPFFAMAPSSPGVMLNMVVTVVLFRISLRLCKTVQQIQANDFAFAAVLADGSVVTWGSAMRGRGDDSSVCSIDSVFKGRDPDSCFPVSVLQVLVIDQCRCSVRP